MERRARKLELRHLSGDWGSGQGSGNDGPLCSNLRPPTVVNRAHFFRGDGSGEDGEFVEGGGELALGVAAPVGEFGGSDLQRGRGE